MFSEKCAKGFGKDQRSIAGKNDEIFGVADGAFGDEHGMAGAILWLLENGMDAERFDGGNDLVCLMANDGNDFFGAKRKAGANDVINE